MKVIRHSFTDSVGSWFFATASPPIELSDYVSECWESGGPVMMDHMKLIPRGTVDFIINLGADQAMYLDGQIHRAKKFKNAWISGLFDKPLFVGPHKRCQLVHNHLVAVSFFPSAMLPVFGIPASELVNNVFEADLLLGPSIIELREKMLEANTTEVRFQLLCDYVMDLKKSLSRTAPFSAMWAAGQLHKSSGLLRIGDLCIELGMSRRQLNRQFLAVTGLGPKAYGRLTRFRSVASVLDYGASLDLTELAYRFGFSDQAHFSREFKHYAGESPRQYLKHVAVDGESVFFD